MKVILFGATGMVGQGVLRECLLDKDIEQILIPSRVTTGKTDPKIREWIRKDPTDLQEIQSELADYDACFFCLGITSVGMSEEQYRHITYDLTLQAARTLVKANPQMTFIYVTGDGTYSSEQGPRMWARVKGKTENDLLKLGFKKAFMFRPAFIQPMNNETSKVGWYMLIYRALKPAFPLVQKILPQYSTSTENMGLAMIKAAKKGSTKVVLNSDDINQLARS